MESTNSEKKQRMECYNCYKLIPADSKFCPYCGRNQLEKSGYTLITPAREQQTVQGQPMADAGPQAATPPPVRQPFPVYPPYKGRGATSKSGGFNWVDLAKYGGVLGTILFLGVLLVEFAGAIYGFTYIPQMDAYPYAFPFYFITPWLVGIYAIQGIIYGIVYVLFVMIAAVCFAYVLRGSRNFVKELKPVSRGLQSSTLFMISTLVMTYYFISIAVVLVVEGLGSTTSAPAFGAAPWAMNVFDFIFAPVWEEIAVRVLLLGLPLLLIAAFTQKKDRPWWKYLAGGNFKMGPAAVFFLILSSVMFGLGHWLAGSGWGFWKIFPASVAGLFLGYLFLKKGLFASIIFHFAIDSQALLVLSSSPNSAVYLFIGISTTVWMVLGAVFFVYYLLVMLSFISSKNMLPRKVSNRYVAAAGTAAAAPASEPVPATHAQQNAGQTAQAQQLQQQAILHPYRPPSAGEPVMRDPHAYIPTAPGEPVFGYMCSNCGSLEAKYKDGKFVCVYCGHESDK